MMKRNKWLISALVAVSLTLAILNGLIFWLNIEERQTTAALEEFLYITLIVLWIDADSKDHPQIARPFDFGFLLYIYWLPYIPYYLWRTRGFFGLLMFVGLIILLLLGWLIELGIYITLAG